MVEYRGGVEGYLAGRRRLERGAVEAAESAVRESPDGGRSAAEARKGPEEGELDRLELELAGLEARLSDPLPLSERELQRLNDRRDVVLNELSILYDGGFEEPLPGISVLEGGLRMWAHRSAAELAVSPAERREEAVPEVSVTGSAEVAHLVLRPPPGSDTLPAVRTALLDGAVRLAFYLLAPAAVQHFSPAELRSRFLRPSGDGWWTVTRDDFEIAEGWSAGERKEGRQPRRRRSRRKRNRAGRSARVGTS